MMRFLDRRTVLRGLGGAVVGLPILEAMLDTNGLALAQGVALPRRFSIWLGGFSLGAYDTRVHDTYEPSVIGPSYDLKPSLATLAGVQDEVSVITGLKIPWARENGGVVPVGGKGDVFHHHMTSPLLAGVRDYDKRSDAAYGPTVDQVIADQVAGSTLFPSVQYLVQAGDYTDVNTLESRMSFRFASSGQLGDEGTSLAPIVSPTQAYQSLFFAAPAPAPTVDPAPAAQQDFRLRTRRSVLDLVLGSRDRLVPRLGKADQRRIEQHFEEIRALELRLSSGATPPPPTAGSGCGTLAPPPPDPGLSTTGWSSEDQRAHTFADILHMAWVCDSTRVASIQMSYFQSYLNMEAALGASGFIEPGLHQLSHTSNSGASKMPAAIAWHYKSFAYFVAKLRDTPEGDSNMLASSVSMFVSEGGNGYDPETDSNDRPHSTENMACLVAGRAGGLKAGHHIRALGMHPAQVHISVMNALGLTRDTLGEVQGNIPEMFV